VSDDSDVLMKVQGSCERVETPGPALCPTGRAANLALPPAVRHLPPVILGDATAAPHLAFPHRPGPQWIDS